MVGIVMPNLSAACLYVSPLDKQSRIICSRDDSSASLLADLGAAWNELTTLRAMELDMGEPPPCTSRIASSSLPGVSRLSMYPLAPADNALKIWSLSSYTVSIMI